VLHPRPAHRASYPVLCAISPRFRLRPSSRSPRGDTLALGYPSALPAWGRTGPLKRAEVSVKLDAVSGLWYARGAFPTSGRAYPAHNKRMQATGVPPVPDP